MKILSLYFKNINSIEGESRIHFDQAPIVDGGVFAITGPNGSGKSSVLDVITLGLYGETFRFDRPADHVMTKLKTESFAYVEFSLGEDRFRSSWHIKRDNKGLNGQLLAPEMKLIQLNGSNQILEDSTQKVRERVAELTGMDFHKFSKSMVLAQGDFAAFLNALDSERMDILEKISGTDIYDDYKKQAEETHQQVQTRLQQLEQDLNAIPLMSDDAKQASEHDLTDFNEQLVELNGEQEAVQQQLSQVQGMTELQGQVGTLVEKQKELKTQVTENQQNLEKIETSQNVMVFQDDLIAVESKGEETQKAKETLDSYRSELEILQKQLKSSGVDDSITVSSKTPSEQKTSIDELKLKVSELKFNLPKEKALMQTLIQQLEEKKVDLNTSSSWLQTHEADKKLLEDFPEIDKLINLRTELAELSVKQKSSAKVSKDSAAALKQNKEKIDSLNKKNSLLTNQIAMGEKALEEMSEGHSLQTLQEMKVDQQERVNNFVELSDLATVNAKLSKKGFFSLFGRGKSEKTEEEQLRQQADHLQMELGREDNIIQTLELAVSNELLLKKMQPDREHLADGKPCPLCGALQHPYSKYAPAVANSKQALADQQKKVKTLTANAESLKKQILSAKKQFELDEQKDGKIQIIRSQWISLSNRLNSASMDLDIDNLSRIKTLLKAEKTELSNITNLLIKYTKQQSQIAQAKETIVNNEVILTRVTSETEELNIQRDSRPQEAVDIEKAYSKCQLEERVATEKVISQLAEMGEKMPSKGKEDKLLESLTVKKQAYQNYLMQQKSLTEEIQSLEKKLETSSLTEGEINQKLDEFSGQVKEEEIVGLHLSLVEKQKLIAEKELQFSQQETELVSLKQHLADKIKDTGHSDLNTIKETIALVQRQPEIQQAQQQLIQNLADVQTRLDDAVSQLETEQQQQKEEVASTEEELLSQQKSLKVKLDITKQEINSIQSKLSKQNELQEKYQWVIAKLDEQKSVIEASDAEMKLMTDENGVHFRQKVQQILIDKLLSKANKILEKLSGRYYVRKVNSEHGLALEIEDTKQKNVRRLPKTLSGGESFIVSLALALALAEMANNGHAVDSLFLDEGFGTLDAESLYLAMTTLEGLKTHGKIVGVISHIDAVRKRIKTQIEMSKKPNGLSALKVIS
jgi:exonuclease SbcC